MIRRNYNEDLRQAQQEERELAAKSAPASSVEKIATRIEEAFVCPHCGGQGWYVVQNRNTGEPEQEQCRWCDDKAGILADLRKGIRP